MMLDLLRDTDVQKLYAGDIATDGGTQMRAALNPDTCAEYRDALLAGAKFPPIVVFYDGERYWLGDGFHRVEAYRRVFASTGQMLAIDADVRSGTRRDAILFAAGANATHGLRRTNADKRRAVETLLRDEEWGKWSDREIARSCGVHHQMVGTLRSSLADSSSERTYTTKHGTTATMKTAKIGTTKPKRTPTPQQRTVAEPVAPTVRYISPDPDEEIGDPLVDVVTVAQVRRELSAEIDAIIGRLQAALTDVEAARRLTEAQGDSDRARAGLQGLIGKVKALKARGL